MTPARHTLAAVFGVLLLLVAIAPTTVLAVDVDWGTATATATYGESVSFVQPATLGGGVKRAELLLELPGAIGPAVTEIPVQSATGATTLRHSLELADGHLLPNTRITARWRIVGQDGSQAIGPATTITYADTRFQWRSRQGDIVRVHWYEGSDAFGQRALEIGEKAIRDTAALLGVSEKQPIDFFVYADQDEFYQALGPRTRENVGGQANAELRTLYALITPAEIDDAWVEVVIPHELVHLVFNTAVDNPYHFPPRWLNEGLAVYLSERYGGAYRAAVEDATRDGSLIPLEGITAQFPTTRDRFLLAYGESVSAVDFLIRKHGRDALIGLVRSYATGLTDDEAFQQAIGLDIEEFDAAWRADLGAGEPTEYGPRPAPEGRLPPGWTTVEASPAATDGNNPPAAPGGPTSPVPAEPTPGSQTGVLVGALVAALVVVIAVVALVTRGRRAQRGDATRRPREADR
jgi:hypothetical protein